MTQHPTGKSSFPLKIHSSSVCVINHSNHNAILKGRMGTWIGQCFNIISQSEEHIHTSTFLCHSITGAIFKIRMTYHSDDFRINALLKDATGNRDIVNQFIETRSFDFFALQVADGVHEIEHHTALMQFFNKKILLFIGGSICNTI